MIKILNSEIIEDELIDKVPVEFWESIVNEEPETPIKLLEAENEIT